MVEDRQARVGGGVTGAILLVLGLLVTGTVMAADVGGTPTLEALAMRLGLAIAPLLLACGISLTLVGGWLLWRARRA